jgi:rubrerythrin
MPSTCPKCHQVLEEDYVCCADVTYTWKCTQCRKLSKGFVIPFGRCETCGGSLTIVDDSAYRDAARLKPVQQALQAEANAYAFYAMLAAEATDPDVRALFASLSQMEREHLENLAAKYHAHLEADPAPASHPKIRQIILGGIEGGTGPHAGHPALGPGPRAQDRLLLLYGRAIEMERQARAFFLRQVEGLEEGLEREVYRELAAEEDEHIALLESGLAKTKAALGR